MNVIIDSGNLKEFNELVRHLDYAKIVSKKEIPLQKGEYKETEKPSDFAGIWKNNTITLKQIRTAVWQRKK